MHFPWQPQRADIPHNGSLFPHKINSLLEEPCDPIYSRYVLERWSGDPVNGRLSRLPFGMDGFPLLYYIRRVPPTRDGLEAVCRPFLACIIGDARVFEPDLNGTVQMHVTTAGSITGETEFLVAAARAVYADVMGIDLPGNQKIELNCTPYRQFSDLKN